jgi:hypothetical protein
MPKFCTMGVTHDTGCKEPHNLLSNIFSFEKCADDVIQALNVLSMVGLEFGGNRFILLLTFSLTHLGAEFLSSANKSFIRFKSQRI